MLPDEAILNSALAIILGITITCVICIVYNRKWFKKLTVKLFYKTPHDNIWRDVIDLENGSNLKVYLKDKNYYLIGHHKTHEENGNDSWLALSAFAKYNVKTNQLLKDEPTYLDRDDIYILIRFLDIEHIEVF